MTGHLLLSIYDKVTAFFIAPQRVEKLTVENKRLAEKARKARMALVEITAKRANPWNAAPGDSVRPLADGRMVTFDRAVSILNDYLARDIMVNASTPVGMDGWRRYKPPLTTQPKDHVEI